MGAETLPLWLLFGFTARCTKIILLQSNSQKSGEYLLDKENRLFYNENVRGSVWVE